MVDLKKAAKKDAENLSAPESRVSEEMLLESCPEEFMKEFKKSKTHAERADLLGKVYDVRLSLGREVSSLEEFEGKLKQWFIDTLPENNATGVAGKLTRVQIKPKHRPSVVDWDKFYGYIKKNNAFDLLNRAVNKAATEARWERGDAIPGVEKFNYSAVSITKVK